MRKLFENEKRKSIGIGQQNRPRDVSDRASLSSRVV